MQVTFYNAFSKRKNSTKKPANTDTHYDIDVVLKEDTTIERPSLVLTNPAASASGNPVTVSSVAGNMVNPVVTLNVIQEGSGTPTPSNPRHIGAYGDARIHVNSDTTIIDFGNAIYGGTLDVTTGVLTVKYKYITFKLADCGIAATYVNTVRYYINGLYTSDEIYKEAQANNTNSLCNYLTYGYDTTDTPHFFYAGTAITTFMPVGTDVNTVMQYIGTLKTPYTVQLTPAQIALAQGTNVVSTNGNSTISFGYLADELATDYCYAYIPKWNKYYFVATPNIITNNHIQYDLEEDYLATRKTEVGSTVAHIAYSSTGYDKYLIDSRLPVKDTVTTTHEAQTSGLSSSGCYILSLITDTANGSQGAAAFYRISSTYLGYLAHNLYDVSVDKIVANAFYDPFNTIIRCIWIPLDSSSIDSNVSTEQSIAINANSVISTSGMPVKGCQVTNALVTLPVTTITISNREQDFRDSQPFTTFGLYLPGVGLTDLNANDFSSSTTVNIYTRVDITTGDIIYWIYNDNGDVVKTVSFNGAAEVPLAHMTANSSGVLSSIGGAVTTGATYLLTGNTTALALGALASASNAAVGFNQRSTSLKGGIQGRSAFADTTISLLIVKQNTADPDNANYIARWGRPVGVTHAISNHSGYVQCDNASVAIAGDNTEREVINNYLNTGFFYE